LNILSNRELLDLFPKDKDVVIDSIHLLGYPSNLLVYRNS